MDPALRAEIVRIMAIDNHTHDVPVTVGRGQPRELRRCAGRARVPRITNEILPAPRYWLAEDYHQQYLAKNPDGYCGIGGCGVAFKPAESRA